jgi:iron complex outermembrane recepter protein
MSRSKLLASVCAIAFLGQVGSALAQAAAADESNGLEEIIVTAQKRSESLQSTPLAVSAFTSEALEQKQISGVAQLQFNVPSLVFAQLTGYSQLSLRGIGSDLTVTAGEPTVATFQDGVYLGQLFAQSVPSFDLERIEVLRGPQGTLYGRNSTGGTINYITKAPSHNFGANFAVGYGSYNKVVVEGGVTGPIIKDTLSARISAKYEDRDGYRTNLFDGKKYDANRQYSVQGALLFEPTSDFSVTLRGDLTRQTSTPVQQLISVLPSAAGISPGTPVGIFSLPGPVLATLGPLFSAADLARIGNGTVAGLYGLSRPGVGGPDPSNSLSFANDFPGRTVVNLKGVSGTLVWGSDALTVKSITAYRYSDLSVRTDNDGTSAPILYEDPINQSSKQFTQEINISGKALDNRLDWLVGGYYFHDRGVLKADLFVPSLGELIVASGSFTNQSAPVPVFNLSQPFIPNLLQIISDPVLGRTLVSGTTQTIGFLGFGADQTSKSAALFGQTTFSITDKLHFTAGLRYTKDTKEVFRQLHSNFVPAAALCDVRSKKSWDAVTGTAGLDYKISDQTLAYAKVSRGYKAGGFNPGECSNSFNPETIWAYEGGLKSTFADGQARVNLAGFYYTFNNIQFTTYIGNASTIRNAANAKLYGLEAEYTIRPRALEGFQLDGSGSYIHSAYGSQLLQDPLGLATLDIKDNQLIRAPKWKLNLGAQFGTDIGTLGAFTLRGETSYTSTVYHDVFNGKAPSQAGTIQPSFWISNARLIWQPAGGQFEAQAFVENIGNSLYAYSRVGSATASAITGQFSPPRTYGIRVSMKLGSAK